MVTTAPYPNNRPTNKDKGKQKANPIITKKMTTRSHIEEINNPVQPQQVKASRTEAMDTDMPIQDKPTKPKASRSRRTEPDIKYDIQ